MNAHKHEDYCLTGVYQRIGESVDDFQNFYIAIFVPGPSLWLSCIGLLRIQLTNGTTPEVYISVNNEETEVKDEAIHMWGQNILTYLQASERVGGGGGGGERRGNYCNAAFPKSVHYVVCQHLISV